MGTIPPMKRPLLAAVLVACAACWPTILLAQNTSDTASQTAPVIQRVGYYQDQPGNPPAEPRTPTVLAQVVPPAIPPQIPPPNGPLPIEPGPNTPPPLPPPSSAGPQPRLPPPIEAPLQRLSVSPRNGAGFQITRPIPDPTDPERSRVIITGGAIITVRGNPAVGLVDLEADRIVIWTRGVKDDTLASGATNVPENQPEREIEFYLAGNVEMRQQGAKDSRVLRADELYYDVDRNVAIALQAQIDFKAPPKLQIPDPIVFRAEEIIQHAENQFELLRGEVASSKLPSDPGLKVYFTQGTIENVQIKRFSPFGWAVWNRQTGEQDIETELYFRGHNVFFDIENIPFFYSPYLACNLLEPLGPVEEITGGYNKVFGFQAGTTLNLYELLGIQPYDGTKWRLHLDYLSARGPAIGSTFDYNGKAPFGLSKGTYDGTLTGYGIYDDGYDVLGGGRNSNLDIPVFRGRALWRNGLFDLPYGFQVQSQVSYLSDPNFLEQYFNKEFETGDNQETYVYVKQQEDNWAWTGLLESRIRPWVTEGEHLPEFAFHIYELPGIDRYVTYMANASIGYDQLRTTNSPGSPPVSVTDQADTTGRADLMQTLSVPFSLGPFRIVPYGQLDLTEYTRDLENQSVGRVWGGGGLRVSLPFSRIYPDIESELFNLNGINHKIVMSANYFYAQTNVSHTLLPQIDRLNDDTTDQALRDIKPQEPGFFPGPTGVLLANSPIYDPQLYAMRRLIENRIDTLDDINELELDLRQRWQTHRGYPGNEHVVDWMTLDLSASYFPNSNQNFGSNFAFLQYDWMWNIGDRTTLTSTAWYDPEENGPREYTFGIYLNRPDRTNFYLGYRQIDPLSSRALTAGVGYAFSPKYSMALGATYDFGNSTAESTSLSFTRTGSDLQVTMGVSYDALQHNFGVQFVIVPNLVPANKQPGAIGALGQGGLLSPTH